MAGAYPLMENLAPLRKSIASIRRAGMHNPVSVSADGDYSIEFVECLASCGTAPVMMVDDALHENVAPEFRRCRCQRRASCVRGIRHLRLTRCERRLIFQNIGAKVTPPTRLLSA